MEASLHRHDWPCHWPLGVGLHPQCLSPSGEWWEEQEFQASHHTLVSLVTSPILSYLGATKSHGIKINDVPVTPDTQEITEVLGALCQELRTDEIQSSDYATLASPLALTGPLAVWTRGTAILSP